MHNWIRFDREFVRQVVARAGFRGEDALLVMDWQEAGMVINPYNRKSEQLACAFTGQMRFLLDGEAMLEEGPSRAPPIAMHFGKPLGIETELKLDVFVPNRADYRHPVSYQNDRYPNIAASQTPTSRAVHPLISAGDLDE